MTIHARAFPAPDARPLLPVQPTPPEPSAVRAYLRPGRLGHQGQCYEVRLGAPDGELIVANSLDAEFAACRVLVGRGVTGKLEFWRPGAESYALRINDVQRAANLTVRESAKQGLRLARYRPMAGRYSRGQFPVQRVGH